jgi:peptide deformylase
MITTMIRSNGIGLAANQVGLNIRLIIVNIAGFKNEIMCNPQITSFHNTAFETHTEGCLSFPGRKQDMRRSQHLTVQYFNLDGTEVIREFTGLTARCIQHEIDHINGITFLDKQWII